MRSALSVGAWTLAGFSSAVGVAVLCRELTIAGYGNVSWTLLEWAGVNLRSPEWADLSQLHVGPSDATFVVYIPTLVGHIASASPDLGANILSIQPTHKVGVKHVIYLTDVQDVDHPNGLSKLIRGR